MAILGPIEYADATPEVAVVQVSPSHSVDGRQKPAA